MGRLGKVRSQECEVARLQSLQGCKRLVNFRMFICLLDSFWGGGRGNDGGKRVWAYG